MSRYRYLFSPMRIGPVVVPNRIVFAAHLTKPLNLQELHRIIRQSAPPADIPQER